MDYRTSLGALLREVVHETFEIDSRLGRTVVPFLFQPGTLTREYNAGRRARFTPPLRLYIFASLLCFLVLGIRSQVTPFDVEVQLDEAAEEMQKDPKTLEHNLEVALRQEGATDEDIARVVDTVTTVRDRASQVDATGKHAGVQLGLEHLPPSWLETSVGRALEKRVDRFEALSAQEQVETIRSGTLAHAPTAMFLLLPFYALLLKVAFLGTGRYYVEHLIFALHLHAFAFLVIALVAAVGTDPVEALILTIPLYFIVALKRAYEIGWLGTFLRTLFVTVGYSTLLTVGTAFVIVAAVIMG